MILVFYINYLYHIFHNMETIIMYLSEALKTIREKQNLTQKELSRMSGISYSTITKIETGVTINPSFFLVVKLCQALEVTPDNLLKLITNYDGKTK